MTSDRAIVTRRTVIVGGAATLATALAWPQPAHAAATAVEVYGEDAVHAVSLLERHPWTPIGTGMPVYVKVSTLCPYCQAMYRNFPGIVPGLELRYIAMPIADIESGAIVKVWQDRSLATFSAYMQGRLSHLPPVRNAFANGFPNHVVPTALNTVEEFYGYYLANNSGVAHRLNRVYPDKSFTGTPSFYVPEIGKLTYADGDQMRPLSEFAHERGY